MAEAHPVGFRWVVKAQERGAKIIHVDPRFSRTSALADIWAPIRAGADIAFLGGLIHYTIEQQRYFKEYLLHFTNASCLVRDDFQDTEDLDGFFSGWNAETRIYDAKSWMYEGDDLGRPRRDLTLQHPRSVFQILRKHFARYTPRMVADVAGIPEELFHKIAETFTAASGPDKTAAICYAVGWTQHSKGVQIIRAAAILQLLLGNIGRPGGGILALRGHASIQGSTDIPTLYDILPGYLPMPKGHKNENHLDDYLRIHRRSGLWAEMPSFMVSLLKAYYGRRATAENEFGYGWLPKVTGDHSHFSFFTRMMDGAVEGLFLMGQNPAVGAQHSSLERKALAKLKWLVVREMVETESAAFWHNSPEIDRGELKTEEISTEVFLFAAAGHAEKEGAFTNTQRMLQWREKAVDPPGDARSDSWFIHQLAKRLRAKAAASADPMDEPLRALNWWYPENAHGEPEMQAVLAEINGWKTEINGGSDGVVYGLDCEGKPHHGPQLKSLKELKPDGSTASGCWIYCGVFGPDKINRALMRKPAGPYGHGWGFAWPSDRRILYNRASARPDGTAWSERKKLIVWDAAAKKWVGADVPDFPEQKPPDYKPGPEAKGTDLHPGDAPFMMHDDGLGWIYVPKGLKDGPLPAHYEPLESPVRNRLYERETNPPVNWFTRRDNPIAPVEDPRFPFVLTTYRLTEHHTAGGMSRFLSHLAELQPEMFAEISPELGALLAIRNGEWVVIATLRSAIEARALISRRNRPIHLNGRVVHQVALPFHWGSAGPLRGSAANDLIPISGEPNVSIHEGKALLCTVLPGRLPPPAQFQDWFEKLTRQQEARAEHEERPPEGAAGARGRSGGHGHEGKPA